MTATKDVTIWCDFGGKWPDGSCNEWINHGSHLVDRTRRLSKVVGWVYRNGQDLCPIHAVPQMVAGESL